VAKQRLKEIAREAKRTTKKVLHIDSAREQIEHGPEVVSHAVPDDIGLNPSKTLDVEASTVKQIKNNLPKPHSAKELKEIIRHPKTAGEEQTAETLAFSENPNISRDEDDELIKAHEQTKAIALSDTKDFGAEEDVSLHESINMMEHDRQQKTAAWISSRYVHCGRVLPGQQYKFPFLSSCRWVDESGEPQGVRWSQLFDQLLSLIKNIPQKPQRNRQSGNSHEAKQGEYDEDVLLQEIERIIISSSPVQRWLSDIRKMRNWRNPSITAQWFATWLAVWSCNRVFTFVYCYGAYRALQTRTSFDKRESLKDAHERAMDDDEMNNTLSEKISHFGSSKWLKPTIGAVAPVLQPKLRSVADWLEIMMNYQERKTDRATRSIFAVLGGAILISSILSTEFCLRMLTLVLILFFFLDKPLSGRYPEYRQVLVPLHWVLWDVPTNTEVSFGYLRQQAQGIRRRLKSDKTIEHGTADATADIELFAAKCSWNDISGEIVLTATDVCFMRSAPRKEMWRRRFEDIVELKKGDGRTSLLHRTVHVAELRFRDGSVELLKHLKKNDTLFNVVFAFSEMQWRQA
jgi:hypothetical protein